VSAADLAGWLERIEKLHPSTIALGLERVAAVRDALAIAKPAPVFVVGGTNGKGSTCALLEAMLAAAGYRVGTYTSPHLLRYNERVRLAGAEADDDTLVAAFEKVEQARGAVPLTYFEFGTLAAWVAFADASLDALVLEVGLGGRLDAVNVFEPDCAVLTSIDLDHMDYLGSTRESIGWEKAHIFRPGKAAICADPRPPATVVEYAQEIGAELQLLGRDFGYDGVRSQWRYWGRGGTRAGLAYPALRGTNQLLNAAATIAALDSLRTVLPVSNQAIRQGLALVQLPARFQVLTGRPTVILDVAHNPHAAAVLAENLSSMGFFRETHAVLAMLADKDMRGVCAKLKDRIDHWYIAALDNPRGASASELAAALAEAAPGAKVSAFARVEDAWNAARETARENDRILVTGSFYTVAQVLAARASARNATADHA
jgi:dihydrofolate synthase/folylpolyglutamate synthase